MVPESATTRPRVEGDREQEILDAALTVLVETGYDRLTMDAVAAEAYLETARQRASVRRHARLIDYPMHDGAAARAVVHCEAAAGQTGTVPKGTRVSIVKLNDCGLMTWISTWPSTPPSSTPANPPINPSSAPSVASMAVIWRLATPRWRSIPNSRVRAIVCADTVAATPAKPTRIATPSRI